MFTEYKGLSKRDDETQEEWETRALDFARQEYADGFAAKQALKQSAFAKIATIASLTTDEVDALLG